MNYIGRILIDFLLFLSLSPVSLVFTWLSSLCTRSNVGNIGSLLIGVCFRGSQTLCVIREVLELSLLSKSFSNRLLRGLNSLLVCKHLIDVAGIMSRWYYRLVRSGHLTIADSSPVDIAEERMTHDILGTVIGGPQAPRLVTIQQRSKQAPRLRAKVFLHWDRHIDNVIHHLFSILLVVRRSSTQHFIDQGSLKI